ncbi:unnamed protein product [Sphenostylis stenocarpa]|uniref:Uncharacterized protein n=1 Tax=Sphenostylis stenocarpa TaxID=92480 RepID=A0AA86VZ07_9FABA|nr:unnamed protein product [Sphenostylis stenocarpa]
MQGMGDTDFADLQTNSIQDDFTSNQNWTKQRSHYESVLFHTSKSNQRVFSYSRGSNAIAASSLEQCSSEKILLEQVRGR